MTCVNTGGNAPSRPAQPVHRLQGIRFPSRDYRIPTFYMITMTALGRKPLFATCENDKSTLNDDGWLMYDLWHRMAKDYLQVTTSTLSIMPDHLHGLVRVKEQMEKPIGVPLRAFKSQVTSALRKRYGNPDLNVWTPGYHDLAVWRRGALDAYIRYMKDNPGAIVSKRLILIFSPVPTTSATIACHRMRSGADTATYSCSTSQNFTPCRCPEASPPTHSMRCGEMLSIG